MAVLAGPPVTRPDRPPRSALVSLGRPISRQSAPRAGGGGLTSYFDWKKVGGLSSGADAVSAAGMLLVGRGGSAGQDADLDQVVGGYCVSAPDRGSVPAVQESAVRSQVLCHGRRSGAEFADGGDPVDRRQLREAQSTQRHPWMPGESPHHLLLPGRVGSRSSGCASLPRSGGGDDAAGVVGGGYALLGCHAHQHLDSDGQIQLI
jgi:hypothetical protein